MERALVDLRAVLLSFQSRDPNVEARARRLLTTIDRLLAATGGTNAEPADTARPPPSAVQLTLLQVSRLVDLAPPFRPVGAG
jgi:hypothetical protein